MLSVALLFGTSAQAVVERTVIQHSFNDDASPALPAATRVGFDYSKTSAVTGTKFVNIYNNNKL